MATKITPKIFNGNWQLVISETLSCMPSQGLQVHVPIAQEKNAIFKFFFKSIPNDSEKSVSVDQENNNLIFTLTNFVSSLGASLSDPFKFHVGKDNFLLQLYGVSTGQDILCMTISVFKEVHGEK